MTTRDLVKAGYKVRCACCERVLKIRDFAEDATFHPECQIVTLKRERDHWKGLAEHNKRVADQFKKNFEEATTRKGKR